MHCIHPHHHCVIVILTIFLPSVHPIWGQSLWRNVAHMLGYGAFENKSVFLHNVPHTTKSLETGGLDSEGDPPSILWGIPDIEALVGRLFRYSIPAHAFTGHITSFKVGSAGRSELPSWLYFNHSSHTLLGIPTAADQGSVLLSVTAVGSSSTNATASTGFLVNIHVPAHQAPVPQSQPSATPLSTIDSSHGDGDVAYIKQRDHKCQWDENVVRATLVLDEEMSGLKPKSRVRLLYKMAHFLGHSVHTVSLNSRRSSVVAKLLDTNVLVAGPGNADTLTRHAGVELSWVVGCGNFKQQQDISQVLEHNIMSNRITEELGYSIIGWHVTETLPPEPIRRQRLKRQAVGLVTAVPTETMATGLPTPVSSLISTTTVLPTASSVATDIVPSRTQIVPSATTITSPTTTIEDTSSSMSPSTTPVLPSLSISSHTIGSMTSTPILPTSLPATSLVTSSTVDLTSSVTPTPSVTSVSPTTTAQFETTVTNPVVSTTESSATDVDVTTGVLTIATTTTQIITQITTEITTKITTEVTTDITTQTATTASTTGDVTTQTSPTDDNSTTVSSPEPTTPTSKNSETSTVTQTVMQGQTSGIPSTQTTEPSVGATSDGETSQSTTGSTSTPAVITQGVSTQDPTTQVSSTAGQASTQQPRTQADTTTVLSSTKEVTTQVPSTESETTAGPPSTEHQTTPEPSTESAETSPRLDTTGQASPTTEVTSTQTTSRTSAQITTTPPSTQPDTTDGPTSLPPTTTDGAVSTTPPQTTDRTTTTTQSESSTPPTTLQGPTTAETQQRVTFIPTQPPTPEKSTTQNPSTEAKPTAQETPTSVDTTELPAIPPLLLNPIDQVHTRLGSVFHFPIPDDTFYDHQDGSTPSLDVTVTTIDGHAMAPDFWVQYDPDTQTLFGIPLLSDVTEEPAEFVVTATNSEGLRTRDAIQILIDTSVVEDISHEFFATFAVRYENILISRRYIVDLITRITSYYRDSEPSHLSVTDIANGSIALSWTNNTLSKTQCTNGTILELYSLLYIDNRINPAFRRAMLPNYPVSTVGFEFAGVCNVTTTNDTLLPRGAASTSTVTIVVLAVLLPVLALAIIFIACYILCCHKRKKQSGRYLPDDEKPIFTRNRKPVLLEDEIELKNGGNKPQRPVVLPGDYDLYTYANPVALEPLGSEPPPPLAYRPPPQDPPPYNIPVDDYMPGHFGPDAQLAPPQYFPGVAPGGASVYDQPPPAYRLPPPYVSRPGSAADA